MHKVKWEFKNSKIDPDKISEFSKQHKIHSIFASVLLTRGIETETQLRQYISKSLEAVHNPNLLPDIGIACERIAKAIENKEKITVYGDYDVDGITSTSLMYSFLKENGADADYYIPDRIKEGYGLNIMAVNKLSKLGTKLLITVDCGISSFGEVELANAQKMDVIITDHHTCRERIPNALAVINPKRPDSDYPFRELAGVGVAFKTMLAAAMKLGLNTKEYFDKYCTLAAIGTIADVVDLQDENRIIADKGLKNLQNTQNPGLNALLEASGAKGRPVTSTTVSFMMAPRINAAGRLEHAGKAAELLLSQSDESAYPLALELDKINQKRQQTEKGIYEEALELIAQDSDFDKKRVIVLAKEGWHHGVIGIVASKITEKFYKPCILLSCEENGRAKGSGRSVEGINLFNALSACEENLTQFGGHALAAGLSLKTSEIDKFTKNINKYVSDNVPVPPEKTLLIDCSVPPSFVTIQNAKQLYFFEPFGMGNEKPVFAMNGVRAVSVSAMGTDKRHLRLNIETEGKSFEAAGFSMGEYAQYITPGMRLDIAFNLDINSYGGKDRIQLILKDIKKSK